MEAAVGGHVRVKVAVVDALAAGRLALPKVSKSRGSLCAGNQGCSRKEGGENHVDAGRYEYSLAVEMFLCWFGLFLTCNSSFLPTQRSALLIEKESLLEVVF